MGSAPEKAGRGATGLAATESPKVESGENTRSGVFLRNKMRIQAQLQKLKLRAPSTSAVPEAGNPPRRSRCLVRYNRGQLARAASGPGNCLTSSRAATGSARAIRTMDMSTSKSSRNSPPFIASPRRLVRHEPAKSELRALMPEGVKAIGHGVRGKRSRSGALSFDVFAPARDRDRADDRNRSGHRHAQPDHHHHAWFGTERPSRQRECRTR
jgi:hypothetical protein